MPKLATIYRGLAAQINSFKQLGVGQLLCRIAAHTQLRKLNHVSKSAVQRAWERG